jgi:hypothetical protein
MGFISDELIRIGEASNPRSNMSMAAAGSIMLDVLKAQEGKGVPLKQLYTIIEFSCKELNKKGYPWFKPDRFFDKP